MHTKSSRRSFLRGSAALGAACVVGSSAIASPLQTSVIVVGAGAFGGWSALHLAQRGAKVTLLDAWGPGNSRASSGGETRTIRATYGPAHLLYTQMVGRALQLWQEHEQRWNLKLFFKGGALRMAGVDDSYESAALPVLKEAGVRFEKLSTEECAKRWPQVNFDGVSWSVYEPDSGFLAARRACEAVLNAFVKEIEKKGREFLMPPYCPREFSWSGIRSSLPIRRAEPVPRMATQLPSLSLGSNRRLSSSGEPDIAGKRMRR